MASNSSFSPANIESLIKFLDQNKDVDFVQCNLQGEENLKNLNFKNLARKKQDITFLIKGFQRLVRIIPEQNSEAALALLKEGIHSALQIAAMTRNQFLSKFGSALGDSGKVAEAIYNNALEKRSAIAVQYMNILQNKEPHISAARFN